MWASIMLKFTRVRQSEQWKVFWQPALPAASPFPRLSVTLLCAQEVLFGGT